MLVLSVHARCRNRPPHHGWVMEKGGLITVTITTSIRSDSRTTFTTMLSNHLRPTADGDTILVMGRGLPPPSSAFACFVVVPSSPIGPIAYAGDRAKDKTGPFTLLAFFLAALSSLPLKSQLNSPSFVARGGTIIAGTGGGVGRRWGGPSPGWGTYEAPGLRSASAVSGVVLLVVMVMIRPSLPATRRRALRVHSADSVGALRCTLRSGPAEPLFDGDMLE